MDQSRRCPQCGAELAGDAPEGLCPPCLMKAGLGAPSGTSVSRTASVPSRGPAGLPDPSPRTLPGAGQTFGPYRLVRLLGKGGMGAVYEAEHLESGRRMALKVLGHSLDSPEARARFLREGRLAASINHPNSVYIYGTEEIEGTPTIAMELVAGGTLEDRVRQKGPLPASEAVDVLLQIIDGLGAAQAIGVLHRDVKPSNCFLETDGTVKVGDFGLSISTKVRGEMNLTTTGAFLGTPAFASPEQMRGDELDVRSDIYSVGVTLYYLLTGWTPFRADNLIRFIATVLERPAESPAKLRPEIPAGLCRVVLRCLEKQPAQRFRNYGDLRQALAPFASAAPTPGTLGLRFLAAAVDMTVWSLAWMPFSFMFLSNAKSGRSLFVSPAFFALMAAGFTLWILYFALAEGLRGASLGKALCRLRVIGPGRSVPGVPRALLRAAIFVVGPVLPIWIYYGFDPERLATPGSSAFSSNTLVSFSVYVLLALLFVTARRRNGFAGVHDLASGTRVIRKAACETRPMLLAEHPALPVDESMPRIGPYHVLEALGPTEAGDLVIGYDARLLRKVWIRRLPEGIPPVAADVRTRGRATRLRWLGGKRTADETWDAYEAPSGTSLLSLLDRRQPWGSVRYWLLDLAEELRASQKDGSAPAALGLDRIWITTDGRAKLLDFAAPGTGGKAPAGPSPALAAADFPAARLFLTQVAIAALEGRAIDADAARGRTVAVPLPLHARTFLEGLPSLQDHGPLIGGLKQVLGKVASVTRWRRFGLAALSGFLPILAGVVSLLGMLMMRHWAQGEPDIEALRLCLMRMDVMGDPPHRERDREARRALEVFIAGRFRGTISDPAAWSSLYARTIPEPWRKKAERIIATLPPPSEKDIAEATALVKPMLEEMEQYGIPDSPLISAFLALIWLWVVALLSLACALLFRGGLATSILGIAVVKRDGSRASRLRVFWRGLVAWSPVLALPLAIGLLMSVAMPSVREPTERFGFIALLAWALYVPLAIWSALLAERGIQDRMAGTWLVPR